MKGCEEKNKNKQTQNRKDKKTKIQHKMLTAIKSEINRVENYILMQVNKKEIIITKKIKVKPFFSRHGRQKRYTYTRIPYGRREGIVILKW